MIELLKMFGLTGIVGLIVAAYLLPKLLPEIIVKVVLGVLEAGAKASGWLLDKVAKGAQHIAQSDAAIITVAVVCLLTAWFSPFKASRVETSSSAPSTYSQKAILPKATTKKSACEPLDVACHLRGVVW